MLCYRAFQVAIRRAVKNCIHAHLQPLLPLSTGGYSLFQGRALVALVPGGVPAPAKPTYPR